MRRLVFPAPAVPLTTTTLTVPSVDFANLSIFPNKAASSSRLTARPCREQRHVKRGSVRAVVIKIAEGRTTKPLRKLVQKSFRGARLRVVENGGGDVRRD